jgi:thymidylate synthase (FAD)
MKACINIEGEIPGYLSIFKTEEVDKVTLFGDLFDNFDKYDDSRGQAFFISKGDLITYNEMLVHYDISVKFTVDRGVSHELVRHRVASFGQESTRYCNYSNDKFGNSITVIDIAGGIQLDAKMISSLNADQIGAIIEEWQYAIEDAESHYLKLMDMGATAQIARSVLPNSTKTEITFTSNIMEWQHFFFLRVPASAHPQMREITGPLFNDFSQTMPKYFNSTIA